MNPPEVDIVDVEDSTADRPAFSDRGDSVVETPAQHLVVLPPPTEPEPPQLKTFTDEELMAEAGVEPIFSTTEAAEFFDRSNQWLYWGLRTGVFTDDDGHPLTPDRIGDQSRGRRRFTLPIIKAIMKSCYRRGNIDPDQLKIIMRRIKYTEEGIEWRAREGWKYVHLGRNRYKWCPPQEVEWDKKTKGWKLRPEFAEAHRRAKKSDDSD